MPRPLNRRVFILKNYIHFKNDPEKNDHIYHVLGVSENMKGVKKKFQKVEGPIINVTNGANDEVIDLYFHNDVGYRHTFDDNTYVIYGNLFTHQIYVREINEFLSKVPPEKQSENKMQQVYRFQYANEDISKYSDKDK